MRRIIDLNFNWLYRNDFKDEYLADAIDAALFSEVSLPHTNIDLPYNYFDESMYAFESCYRKEIDIPEEFAVKSVFLCFQGAAHRARVFVNGRLAAEHKGGYTGFEVRLDGFLSFGKKNTFVVQLDSSEREEIPPFGNVVDYLTYGGIYREVFLKVVDPCHISDVFVRTPAVLESEKTLVLDITLSRAETGLSVCVRLDDRSGKTVASFSEPCLALRAAGVVGAAGADSDMRLFSLSRKIGDIELWDTENPCLYNLTVTLERGGTRLDEVAMKTGFREAEFRTDGFYLNGKKLKIRGLNRHQSFAHAGYAMPAFIQAEDARILKEELGVDLVRTSHYPQSQHFIDECDRLGLLVFTEIPGWQFISENPEWRSLALGNVGEMIAQNRNHASIVLWGVRINESPDDDELYAKTNAFARLLDPTRQTGGVRCIAGSRLLEDVYTYNDFIHTGKNSPLARARKITRSSSAPYLVSEHNGHMFPTKKFDHEEKRIEHALRHMRVLDTMYGNARISGAVGWCMADYNTHKDFGSGDKICYHGVLDMFRIQKTAAWAYSSQQEKKPVMEVASSMDIGEHPGSLMSPLYIFTNCDFVRFYKNEELIGDFYPDRIRFPNVPHAPVLVDDLVGPSLERNEGLAHAHAEMLKSVLNYAAVKGSSLPLKYLMKMAWVMLRTHLRASDGYRLFSTYIGNWGGKRTVYRFEGFTNGTLVKTTIKSSVQRPRLTMKADRSTLVEDKTWDAVRIVLSLVCENGNLLPYSNEALTVTCEGPISLIGSPVIALIGGSAGLYIKTRGLSGRARVTVASQNRGECFLDFEVEKKTVQ